MATISWTDRGLPECFLRGAGRETRKAFWANDPADVGAGRRRARFSRVLRQWPQIQTPPITRAVVELIETFFDTTTSKGAKTFDFPRPRRLASDDSVVTVTVKFTSEIEIVPLASGWWQVQFGVEEV